MFLVLTADLKVCSTPRGIKQNVGGPTTKGPSCFVKRPIMTRTHLWHWLQAANSVPTKFFPNWERAEWVRFTGRAIHAWDAKLPLRFCRLARAAIQSACAALSR